MDVSDAFINWPRAHCQTRSPSTSSPRHRLDPHDGGHPCGLLQNVFSFRERAMIIHDQSVLGKEVIVRRKPGSIAKGLRSIAEQWYMTNESTGLLPNSRLSCNPGLQRTKITS